METIPAIRYSNQMQRHRLGRGHMGLLALTAPYFMIPTDQSMSPAKNVQILVSD